MAGVLEKFMRRAVKPVSRAVNDMEKDFKLILDKFTKQAAGYIGKDWIKSVAIDYDTKERLPIRIATIEPNVRTLIRYTGAFRIVFEVYPTVKRIEYKDIMKEIYSLFPEVKKENIMESRPFIFVDYKIGVIE